MEFWMLILRLVHILSGIFWAGTAFFLVSFVGPAVLAAGPEGQKFMRQLGVKSGMSMAMAGTASLTAISGIIMFIIRTELDMDVMSATYYEIIALGGLFGLAGWIVGFVMQNRSTSTMRGIVAEIEASGGPPTDEQMAHMQFLAGRINQGSRITAVLLTVSVVSMAAARPLTDLLS